MPTIKVIVTKGGQPSAQHRVALDFDEPGGGMSRPEYTDKHGVAEFRVQSGQSGYVYVDGRKQGKWGGYGGVEVRVEVVG